MSEEGPRLDYAEIIRDGDRIWLTAVREGVRVRVLEIPVSRATLLNYQLAEAIYALAGR